MGLAIDTVGVYLTNAGTTAETLTDGTASPGDSLSVRNFQSPAYAKFEALFYNGPSGDQLRVKSPLFHDNVTGITYAPAEVPSQFLMPAQAGQQLYSSDTLSVQMGAAAGASSVAALLNYYSDLPGASARLHSWGDISGIIKAFKTWQVPVTTSATPGTWVDTAINNTASQFHAGYDYAILGFQLDTAIACVAVKGQETGNLRIGAPGTTDTLDISNYFVNLGNMHNTPHIPVFNADNAGSYYVSALDNAASTSLNVYVVAVELQHTISP